MSITTSCKTPCNECAFRRDSKGGIKTLGGSPPEVYVGQIHGPFRIPCHKHYPKTQDEAEWRASDKVFEIPQCAGAAVFRANVGRSAEVPEYMHMPADREAVFSSYAEFYSHHKGISLFEAEKQLQVNTPTILLNEQLGKKAARVKKI